LIRNVECAAVPETHDRASSSVAACLLINSRGMARSIRMAYHGSTELKRNRFSTPRGE